MVNIFAQSWLWGLLGAVIPANSELIACLTAARQTGGSVMMCILKLGSALIVGAIGAAAFTPSLAQMAGRTSPHDMVAVATLIGLFANGCAPVLIKFGPRFADTVLTVLKGKPNEP